MNVAEMERPTPAQDLIQEAVDICRGDAARPASAALPDDKPTPAPAQQAKPGLSDLPDPRMLPEVRKVAEYLRTMKFKRCAVGGVDEDDVLGHFDRVTRMYNDALVTLQESQAARLDAERAAVRSWAAAREAELSHAERAGEQERRQGEDALRARCEELEDELARARYSGDQERRRAEEDLVARREELEADYREKADRLLGSLSHMDEVCKGIVSQADSEAEGLMREARVEADRIVREARADAERIVGEARAAAFEERRRAEDAASRSAAEVAESEDRLRRLRAESSSLRSEVQKTLDRVQGALSVFGDDGVL